MAFKTLFETYYSGLCDYGQRLFQDHDLAEGTVQDVFCRLWEKRESLNIETNPKGYLIMAVKNSFLNYQKKEKAQGVMSMEVEHVGLQASSHLPAFDLRERIREAYQALPEQCGRIFKMSREEGLKYPEIAERLGISVKTVENQMGKGLKIFRTHLKEYLPLLIITIMEGLC